ncbi:hypothetical protein GGX14DRAFT_624029 [Mycena pura]|uniref:Uncharacterized protein n=1 Tax=Mycena pura TaxID=153505 RepID=A0AAD6VF94_9AGAR|nr:hypothetical protein GGX14DRAFT_624029 [Mycena pura]
MLAVVSFSTSPITPDLTFGEFCRVLQGGGGQMQNDQKATQVLNNTVHATREPSRETASRLQSGDIDSDFQIPIEIFDSIKTGRSDIRVDLPIESSRKSDDVQSRKTAPVFIKNVTDLLETHDVVTANNAAPPSAARHCIFLLTRATDGAELVAGRVRTRRPWENLKRSTKRYNSAGAMAIDIVGSLVVLHATEDHRRSNIIEKQLIIIKRLEICASAPIYWHSHIDQTLLPVLSLLVTGTRVWVAETTTYAGPQQGLEPTLHAGVNSLIVTQQLQTFDSETLAWNEPRPTKCIKPRPRHSSSAISPKSRWGVQLSYPWLHKNWYQDPTLPEPWSTDWEDWAMLESWFIKTVDGKRGIDCFRDTWALPGPIEPVAYVTDERLYLLFYAGGRHYYWADAHLNMHRKVFASHKDFMRYVVRGPGWSHMPDIEIPMRSSMDWWGKYSMFA